jgi:hypothetical protein
MIITTTSCGKKFLQTSLVNWNKYLDIVSPDRNKIFQNPFYNKLCGFKNKDMSSCPTCNKNIGEWRNCCVKTITSENVIKYKNIFKPMKEYENKVTIEIYTNDKTSSTL